MALLEESGIRAFVGEVNMNRNGGVRSGRSILYQEKGADASAAETLRWLRETEGRHRNIRPILTPRFTPSCSDRCMGMPGEIQKVWKLSVQSHLSDERDIRAKYIVWERIF